MCKNFGRSIAIILTAAILMSAFSSTVLPAAAEKVDTGLIDHAEQDENAYSQYLENFGTVQQAAEAVNVSIDTFLSNGADAEYKDGILLWNNGTGELTFDIDVNYAALYNIKIVWKPVTTGVDLSLGLKIDGKFPFSEAEKLVLNREWKNATETPRVDDQGNEYAQEQVETGTYITEILHDNTGVITEPYEFLLTEGKHTLTLCEGEQSIEIKAIELIAPEQAEDYKTISADYSIKNLEAEIIEIQGESANVKTTNSIIPKSNNSDSGMTPVSPYKTKINYIGSTAWQAPGEKLAWEFEVEKSGYYYINMRYKQADLVNGESLRWLKIDGETPFKEAENISFPYGTGWEYYTFGDSAENPYYIWLDEGPHTISMEVTMGEQSEYFSRLSEIVDILGDEYIKIIMITSESPDVNRDYELFNQIPDFNETLTKCRDLLDGLVADMKENSNSNSTQAVAAMENMSRVLNNMIRSPYIAQQYVSDYYSNYTSVSSWLYDMKKMPLSLDEIQLVPVGKEHENKNPNIFKKFWYGVVRLATSFTTDYSISTVDSEKSDKTVRLWVNWGQDQASVLNSLVNDSFTPETGIEVQLEIVNASLINGILSGNFPDVVLHMSRTDPVNLGIRGALADLTQFSDYKQVLKQFQEGSEIPYTYNDSLYALPDMQSFFLMFYRTDIFEDLGLSVPNTWEEFKHAATIIQRNNMSVYVPYTQIASSTTVNSGIGNLHLYPTLMMQNGLSIYNKKLNATDITSKAAVDVFDEWTEFYTDYNFYKESDFYNRFRVGVMPLGIATQATYLTLYSAAPEITGRWAVAMVPGTLDESGNINRTIAGGGTGCGIVEKSENKEEAWEFLKWWISAKTQSRYSNNVESILGTISRVTTSNVEAFESLAWDKEDLNVIMQQWEYVSEIPEVPGSYYVTRAVDQAYWAVINGNSTSKDAVVKWSKNADDEITRKIKQYS